MLAISNADRVVFPAIGRTKGEVVAYSAPLSSSRKTGTSGEWIIQSV